MKLKKDFITHDSENEQIMVGGGKSGFSGLVRSNSTASYIVNMLKTETTVKAIVDDMDAKYDAPREVIESDVNRIIATLRSIGAIDE